MVLKPEKEKEAEAIFRKWGLDFAVVGHTTPNKRFIVTCRLGSAVFIVSPRFVLKNDGHTRVTLIPSSKSSPVYADELTGQHTSPTPPGR